MNTEPAWMEKLRLWMRQASRDDLQVFLVGGAVRDLLLGRPLKDFDLACSDAVSFAARMEKAADAAVVRFEKKPEAVCYRIVDRSDPDNFLDVTQLAEGDIHRDLRRRDFTINAMAMRIHPDGKVAGLIDPLGGRTDLEDRIVRCTGPEALSDDPLRILRAWRFAAELGMRIDDATRKAMAAHVHGLGAVAVERVVFELFRILAAADCGKHVREMAAMSVLDAIFPEKAPGGGAGFGKLSRAWDGNLEVLDACEAFLQDMEGFFPAAGRKIAENLCPGNRLQVLKLAALIYGTGISDNKGIEPPAEAVTRRLKLSNRDREMFQRVLAAQPGVAAMTDPRAVPSMLVRFFSAWGDDGIPAILLGMAVGRVRGAGSLGDPADALRPAVSAYYAAVRSRLEAKDLIGGEDLKAVGMAPGPRMGALLGEVRRAQDEGEIASREEALTLARRLLHGV